MPTTRLVKNFLVHSTNRHSANLTRFATAEISKRRRTQAFQPQTKLLKISAPLSHLLNLGLIIRNAATLLNTKRTLKYGPKILFQMSLRRDKHFHSVEFVRSLSNQPSLIKTVSAQKTLYFFKP